MRTRKEIEKCGARVDLLILEVSLDNRELLRDIKVALNDKPKGVKDADITKHTN